MATSDEMAMGVLQTARRLGLSIPRDLSVIGIDDHVLSEVMDLTTIARTCRRRASSLPRCSSSV